MFKGKMIDMFDENDLYYAVCGSDVLDFKELKKTTIYDEGYTEESETIKDFWRILLEDFTEENKKDFLKFLTGSDRSPIRGLSDIKMTITKNGEGNLLPSSHTCFNNLMLPDFRDYETLKAKLLLAIQHNEGFGMF